MKTLNEIQKEVHAWSLKNFGDQPSYRPLLGIVEEVGELCSDHLKKCVIEDSIGDTLIYICDFSSREGIYLEDKLLTPAIPEIDSIMTLYLQLFSFVGQLSHDYLKHQQGIRNVDNNAIEQSLKQLVLWLSIFCFVQGYSIRAILNNVWGEVSHRDWTKNKKDGKV